MQVPAWQLSVCVHALPSLHAVPFAAFGFEHVPVAALHTPGTWHASRALHATGFEPTQVPDWQVSVWVHALPSLQAAVLLVKTQPEAGLHVSVVQTLPSSQTTAVPPHMPPLQASRVVHTLPSLHGLASFAVKTQPVAGLQLSSVQERACSRFEAFVHRVPP